jgi:hypothetical protein
MNHLDGSCGIDTAHSDEDHCPTCGSEVGPLHNPAHTGFRLDDLHVRLLAIIDRAEYAGRQDGISKATRSSKRSKDAREASDLSSRLARSMATDLMTDLVGRTVR